MNVQLLVPILQIMKKQILITIFIILTSIDLFPKSIDFPVVFVSRNHYMNGNILYPQAGLIPGMGPHSRFSVVGGRLMIKNETGNIITLIDSTMSFNGISIVDVQQPCVNWDGIRIIFAGVEHRDSSWRIYEIKKDGTGFRKITFTDRFINLSQFGQAAFKFTKYNDIDPIYMPDGKIVFSSTRFPCISQFGAVLTTNLFIVDSTGINMFRITTERNGAEKPTVDPITGRIVYSRWWLNIDLPSNVAPNGITRDTSFALTNDNANIWQAAMINPDADMLSLYAGDPRNRKSLFGYRPRIDSAGNMFACYVPDMSMYCTGGSSGIRYYAKGLNEFNHIAGVDTSTQLYVQNPPSYGTMLPPYAVDPVPISNERVMFSYAPTVIQQDYGVFTCTRDGLNIMPIVDLPVTLELNAEVLLPKKKPPIADYLHDYDLNKLPPTSDPSTFYQGGLFRFDCMNMYANGPVDAPIVNAPSITKNARIRFFVNHQRQNPFGLDEPILVRTVKVDYDGKIAEGDIAANIQSFEQVVDSAGKVLKTGKRSFAHVTGFNFANNGSGTKCVGCHAGHTQIKVPLNITESQFTNLSTSANTFASSTFSNSDSRNVIDRRARNKDLSVNWISNGGINENVELRWEIPIDLREIKLYNVLPNSANQTNIQVTDCEVYLYYNEQVVQHILSTGALDINGKSVFISPWQTINKLKIIIKSYSGLINGMNLSSIAEVETIARVNNYETVGIRNPNEIANSIQLYQNYPNPFNASTVIKFNLSKTGFADFKVYDINGREVDDIKGKIFNEGPNTFIYKPNNLSSGIYFLRLTSNGKSKLIKLLHVK